MLLILYQRPGKCTCNTGWGRTTIHLRHETHRIRAAMRTVTMTLVARVRLNKEPFQTWRMRANARCNSRPRAKYTVCAKPQTVHGSVVTKGWCRPEDHLRTLWPVILVGCTSSTLVPTRGNVATPDSSCNINVMKGQQCRAVDTPRRYRLWLTGPNTNQRLIMDHTEDSALTFTVWIFTFKTLASIESKKNMTGPPGASHSVMQPSISR